MTASRIVPFQVNKGLPDKLFARLEELSLEHGWEKLHFLPVENIVVADWVQLKCRYGCPNFDSNWCCPPATPNADAARSLLQEYTQSLLLVGRQTNPQFYRNSKIRRSKQVKCWKETVSLERFLFLQGYYKAFSLLPGACALCRECGYPHTCHFPRERRPSLEAFSIDVIATVQSLGISTPVASGVKDVFFRYAVILVE